MKITSLERIIIDLQEKVLDLTDKVETLTKEVNSLKEENNTYPISAKGTNTTSKIKGSISKDKLIASIKKDLSNQINADDIVKGTRRDGSGIIIKKGSNTIKICLRGSGYYGKKDVSSRMMYTGFSTLTKGTIENDNGQMNYDFYVFGVNRSDDSNNPMVEFFVFDQNQFKNLLEKKIPSGKNQSYYFYFGETTDGQYIDDRERDKVVSIDNEHNNWTKLIKKYEEL